MSSVLKNKNIDINVSLYENFLKASTKVNSISDIKVIKSNIAGEIDEYINVPIYELILAHPELRSLLKVSLKNGGLTTENLLNILEISLPTISFLNSTDASAIILFLTDLISIKKIKTLELFQKSKILTQFVADYDHLITKDNNHTNEDLNKCFLIRIFILKLFAFGLVDYNYRTFAYGDEGKINGYKNIIVPLIISRNFGQLRLVFNSKNINENNIDMIISLIEETFKEMYKSEQTTEDISKDQNVVQTLNQIFDSIVPGHQINPNFTTDGRIILARTNN